MFKVKVVDNVGKTVKESPGAAPEFAPEIPHRGRRFSLLAALESHSPTPPSLLIRLSLDHRAADGLTFVDWLVNNGPDVFTIMPLPLGCALIKTGEEGENQGIYAMGERVPGTITRPSSGSVREERGNGARVAPPHGPLGATGVLRGAPPAPRWQGPPPTPPAASQTSSPSI